MENVNSSITMTTKNTLLLLRNKGLGPNHEARDITPILGNQITQLFFTLTLDLVILFS